MTSVGIKARYQGQIKNEETGNTFEIFITKDFCEKIAIRSDFVDPSIYLTIGDMYRVDFVSLYTITKEGKTKAFLGCKVIGEVQL